MDDFAYSNTDMVILIAAGNCGDSISECEYLVNGFCTQCKYLSVKEAV